MVNEGINEGLPDLNLSPTNVKSLRQLGVFDDEVKLMVERLKKAMPFPKDELIICAMGATRVMCPFDAETWICNMGYWQVFQLDGHFTRLFLTHTQVKDIYGTEAFNWEHFNKLANAGIRIYNTHKVKGLNSIPYPYKRISKKFNTEYFSNTISYMIALALDMGYKKIRFYGCDMMTSAEYAWEKGGLEYWLGRAHGMGVKTEISEGSSLLKTITGKPYGVKYYNLKDIDPTGLLRKKVKKSAPKLPEGATGFFYENPIKPPDPQLTPFVHVTLETKK